MKLLTRPGEDEHESDCYRRVWLNDLLGPPLLVIVLFDSLANNCRIITDVQSVDEIIGGGDGLGLEIQIVAEAMPIAKLTTAIRKTREGRFMIV